MSSPVASIATPIVASSPATAVPSFLTENAADFVELLAGKESGSAQVSGEVLLGICRVGSDVYN